MEVPNMADISIQDNCYINIPQFVMRVDKSLKEMVCSEQ